MEIRTDYSDIKFKNDGRLKLLIIVGDNRRVDFMIDNNRRTLRYTCLKELLKELNSHEEAENTLF